MVGHWAGTTKHDIARRLGHGDLRSDIRHLVQEEIEGTEAVLK